MIGLIASLWERKKLKYERIARQTGTKDEQEDAESVIQVIIVCLV
jgi:hypothetical protein